MGDFHGNPGFKGRYLPFLMAAADKYLKPAIRYQGGAYDSGIDFYIPDLLQIHHVPAHVRFRHH